MTKIFAAIGADGFVMFTVEAANSVQARADVRSVMSRSETVDKVRLLRADDISRDGVIAKR
jgi:hypothetical protein